MATLTYRDETATGREVDRWTLPDVPDRITIREIVRLRVREEVARHNASPARHFRGLVQPSETEVELNGYRLKKVRTLDWEKQADIAEDAFARNGFFILVGDRQVEDLDEVVDLAAHGRDVDGDGGVDVAFVKLVPLVGG